jgi:hypothetical protein
MRMMESDRRTEAASAIVLAVVAMVVASILAVAIYTATGMQRDRTRDQRDRASSSGPADEGVRAYQAALSAGLIGEHTAFQMTRAALLATVRESNPGAGMCSGAGDALCLVTNASTSFPQVDAALVPNPADQLTVRRSVGDGMYRFWQVLAVSSPRFGLSDGFGIVSPGGAVVVYVRAWQGGATPAQDMTRPIVQRAVLRPPTFSDFQLAADGQMFIGAGTNINGRVHSNGFRQSLADQYRTLPDIITVTAGATCTSTARFLTVEGTVSAAASPSCSAADINYQGRGQQLNLLRAGDTARQAMQLCPAVPPASALQIHCITSPAGFAGPYDVTLSGTTVTVAGRGAYQAQNQRLAFGDMAGSTGLVLVLDRSVNLQGQLAADSRATIIATNRTSAALSEVPTIHLRAAGSIGAANDPRSTLGLIADGDVVAHEGSACPLQLRAALIAQGGLLSRDPAYRGGNAVLPGAPRCNGGFALTGSSVGHLFHYLATVRPDGSVISGYATRSFSWDSRLYDNPPPLFPTSGDWQVLENGLADLECITNAAAPRLVDRPGCR